MKLFVPLLQAVTVAAGTTQQYQVTSCNGHHNAPELTFRLHNSFVESNNFNTTDYDVDGDYFSKSVSPADLTFMMDDEDYWSLNYQVTSPAKIYRGMILQKEFSLDLKCKYARSLSTNIAGMLVEESDFGPNENIGVFAYDAAAASNQLGSRTTINITPQFQLASIQPSITECKISLGAQEIYPIHTFHPDGTTCRDEIGLNVQTTRTADGGLTLEYNSFHFIRSDADLQAGVEQELELTCILHIFEADGFVEPSIDHCDCHNSAECEELRQTQWSDWGACDVSCGTGNSTRTRTCTYEPCDQPLTDIQDCNDKGCLSDWTDWGSCSMTCGSGSHSRSRTCSDGVCDEDLDETQDCNNEGCLSDWTDWGSCSMTCGSGSQARSRTCSDGVCDDDLTDTQDCNNEGCLSDWTDWGSCSMTCGTGSHSRSRTCSDGVCDDDLSEQQDCNDGGCLSDWGAWGSCSAECGGGTEERTRTCSDGDCADPVVDSRACNEQACPVCDGNYPACPAGTTAECKNYCQGDTCRDLQVCAKGNDYYLALNEHDNVSVGSGGGKPQGTVRYQAVKIFQEADGVYLDSHWEGNDYAVLVSGVMTAEWAAAYDCHGTYATTTASLRGHNLQFVIDNFIATGWAASGDVTPSNNNQDITIRIRGRCGLSGMACHGGDRDFCHFREYDMGYVAVNLI